MQKADLGTDRYVRFSSAAMHHNHWSAQVEVSQGAADAGPDAEADVGVTVQRAQQEAVQDHGACRQGTHHHTLIALHVTATVQINMRMQSCSDVVADTRT